MALDDRQWDARRLDVPEAGRDRLAVPGLDRGEGHLDLADLAERDLDVHGRRDARVRDVLRLGPPRPYGGRQRDCDDTGAK